MVDLGLDSTIIEGDLLTTQSFARVANIFGIIFIEDETDPPPFAPCDLLELVNFSCYNDEFRFPRDKIRYREWISCHYS
ncbi:hypothetical protein V6N11_070667 [Hibiscus sabdariffa]|uniref:Uncharacterized protein n=1 Tax=Hibiscus sabdariffa TaxID=183260 RepID=A0ABR2QFP8_9ROSI